MKVAYLVERPTQFEAPFFRFAALDREHRLRVVFTAPEPAGAVFDPELGREVSWGFDLLAGYPHSTLAGAGGPRRLTRELASESTDLLIVNGYTRLPYLRAALAARRAGIATGLRLDSARFPGEGPPAAARRLLFRLVLRRLFDLFFAVGGLTREYLRQTGTPEERIALFPYAVDIEAFGRQADEAAPRRPERRETLGVPAAARLVLALAKLNDREAPWDLLRALTRLDDPEVWLVVAGDGPARSELEAFAGRERLDRVRFTGYVPYAELPGLYASADLFVHAPREERWGVSVAEALACGLPVVASSRVGAAHDLIEPGKNGFLYPAGDDHALAGRIAAALTELPPAEVERQSAEILARWDYAASWRGILRAAAALPARRADRA